PILVFKFDLEEQPAKRPLRRTPPTPLALVILKLQSRAKGMAIRIEICGGIASGKTTFASLFEQQAKIIYEDFQAVPFWQDFYAAPAEHAFETELSFLLQHYHQVKRAQSKGQSLVVCDFSFV